MCIDWLRRLTVIIRHIEKHSNQYQPVGAKKAGGTSTLQPLLSEPWKKNGLMFLLFQWRCVLSGVRAQRPFGNWLQSAVAGTRKMSDILGASLSAVATHFTKHQAGENQQMTRLPLGLPSIQLVLQQTIQLVQRCQAYAGGNR